MRLGIDASNIRGGGGVTHLVELLGNATPQNYGFDRVTVWSGKSTLQAVKNRPWLNKVHVPLLDRALPMRLYWQTFMLDRLAHLSECDVLLVPGGSYAGRFRPFVTMSQNLLPFEPREIARYGLSLISLRFPILRHIQSRTFARSDGVIFLSSYAHDVVKNMVTRQIRRNKVIPHGVSKRFYMKPKEQKPISYYSLQKPLKCLYVSSVTVYKHQWNVAEAVSLLRQQGYPIVLDLVGPTTTNKGRKLLQCTLQRLDPTGDYIFSHGHVNHEHLSNCYRLADIFVFASTCETFGQVVLEAMASGLPIACSNYGPMAEIVGEHGVYFDPENSQDIAKALKMLIGDPTLRTVNAVGAYATAKRFTWQRCAHETFSFLAEAANCT